MQRRVPIINSKVQNNNPYFRYFRKLNMLWVLKGIRTAYFQDIRHFVAIVDDSFTDVHLNTLTHFGLETEFNELNNEALHQVGTDIEFKKFRLLTVSW